MNGGTTVKNRINDTIPSTSDATAIPFVGWTAGGAGGGGGGGPAGVMSLTGAPRSGRTFGRAVRRIRSRDG